MLLIWIPIIIIVIVSVVGSVFYLKKRDFFIEHNAFVEFWGIVISILFALFAFLQTQSSMESSTEDFANIVGRMDSIITKAEESSTSLHKLEESLSNLPPQIDSFSKSIQSLNNIVATQKEELGKTLKDFNASITHFKSSVDEMVKKFNRKPLLYLDMLVWANDTSRTITNIVINNHGSLMAEVNMVRFQIPKKNLIKFEMKDGNLTDENNGILYYQVNFPFPHMSIIADTLKPKKLECNIIIDKDNFDIKILAYYKAEFGNDGVDDEMFYFEKDAVRPVLLRPRY